MPRRLLVDELHPGLVELPPAQAHHARDVLRLETGTTVELFTAGGQSAIAKLVEVSQDRVTASVGEISRHTPAFELVIASAIPKANRADWMIEKLAELNVSRFIPLQTARSVVHPEGKNKIERWQRISAEASKQCRRPSVMGIDSLTHVNALVQSKSMVTAFLSTQSGAAPITPGLILDIPQILLLIGPEGGWSDEEIQMFTAMHLTPLTLGATILRVETAALAAAAIVASHSSATPSQRI